MPAIRFAQHEFASLSLGNSRAVWVQCPPEPHGNDASGLCIFLDGEYYLANIRAGKANASMLDGITVDYYGSPTPINQVATISVPEARQLMVKPFDASVMKDLEKAILKSDLGLTPQSDGKVLRLQMPHLSGEQREKYAAKVKQMCEESRVAM